MNYGILQNRRHVGGKTNGPTAGPIPLQRIAAQMGVDPTTLGAEAQNIWSMLDDMSQNDPTAYREFIAKQMKEENAKKFTPTPGFVAKVYYMKLGQRMKLFLNCCVHPCVAIPKNPNNGKDVPQETRSVPNTNNLEIPLAIGEIRSFTKQDKPFEVVDAVFHPWVLERARWDANFKADIVQLARSSVENEKKVKCEGPGKLIKSLYKGGYGTGCNVVCHDFIVPSDLLQEDESPDNNASPKPHAQASQKETAKPQSMKQAPILQTPKDVLKGLAPSNQEEINEEFDFKLPSTATTMKSKKTLIEVVNEPKETPVKTKSGRKSSVVTKGFLNKSSKAPLYPNGSTEGVPSSAYVNLLHRSKVVDMNTMPPPQKESSKPQKPKPRKSSESEVFDLEFDRLCMDAEPELDDRHKGDASLDPFLNPDLADFLLQRL